VDSCECGNEPPGSIICGECSLFPDQKGNKLRLSKVFWAEEWIDLARVGTVGGLL